MSKVIPSHRWKDLKSCQLQAIGSAIAVGLLQVPRYRLDLDPVQRKKKTHNTEKTWPRIFRNLHSLTSNTIVMSKFHFPEDCWFDCTAIQVLNSFILDWMLVCDCFSSVTDGVLNRNSNLYNVDSIHSPVKVLGISPTIFLDV